MHVWAGAVVVTSILSPQATPALAFTPGAGQPRKNVSALGAQGHGERSLSAHGRRSILRTCAAASLAFVGGGQRLVLGGDAARLQVIADAADPSRSAVAVT